MKTLKYLIKRDIKLFFKDKGMFFTSLITPLILLMLYATFLGNVYRDAFVSAIDMVGVKVKDDVIDALVGGQLFSSLLAVSCVTVSFCANFLMVQDKANGISADISITPTSPSLVALGYYLSTTISATFISVIATIANIIYLKNVGWYLTTLDIVYIFIDVVILVAFGTALSSVINFFLSTQGQISAVGSIVSSCYGFICGAYMPLSQLSEGFRRVTSFLPGTYGTSLLRQHTMGSAFDALENEGIPLEIIDSLKEAVDYNVVFFDKTVSTSTMYLYLVITVLVLIIVYVLLNIFKKKKKG